MKIRLIFKNLLMVVMILTTFSIYSVAQNVDQIENLKIAYITKELNLNNEQAQKFWPVYNKYESQIRSLYSKFKNEDVSADEMIAIETEILNVKKKKVNALKDILTKNQVSNLIKAEKKFIQKLLDKLKNG